MLTLVELGGVFGLYFFVQAYGYTWGLKIKAPKTVNESVILGFKHLSSMLLPWRTVAAPVSPLICGVLILFAPYLSKFHGSEGYELIRWFLAVLFAVSMTSILGFCSIETSIFRFFVDLHKTFIGTIRSLIGYLVSISVMVFVSHLALVAWLPDSAMFVFRDKPFSIIAAALELAILYFLTYLGSVFDGSLDRKMGN